MKTIYLLLIIFLVSTQTAFNQDTTYQRSFGGDSYGDIQNDLKKMKMNGYLVTGSSNSFSSKGDYDAYCIRLSREGKVLWSKVYGTFLEESETKCWGTRDSGFIIAFETRKKIGKDSCIFVVKCNKNGNIQWSKSIKNSEIEINIPQYIYQSKQGDYYLLNERVDGYKNDHFSLIKLNGAGELKWGKSINSKALYDFITGQIAETNNGNIIVSGYSLGNNFNTNGSYIILYVFDKANGNINQCKKICTPNCSMYNDLRPDNFYVINDTIHINGLYSPDNYFTLYTCWFAFKLNDTQVNANFNLLKNFYNSIQYLINNKFIHQPEQGYQSDLLFTDDGGYLRAYSHSGDITIDKHDKNGKICTIDSIPSIDTSIFKTNFFISDKTYEVLDDTITATNTVIKTQDVKGQKTTCFSIGTTKAQALTESNTVLLNTNIPACKVYPNPSKDFVIINLKSGASSSNKIEFINTEGKIVIAKNQQLFKGDNSVKFNVKSLQPGAYYIKINGPDKPVILKFLKE